MPRNELIGDLIKTVADDVRLGPDAEHVVARPLDQRRFPSSRDRAQRIPGVAGDKTMKLLTVHIVDKGKPMTVPAP